MTTGEKIRQARQAAGITMKELADAAGVSEGTVSRWESGDIENMKQNRIQALAAALHVSPAYLLSIDPAPAVPSPAPPEAIGHRIRAARESHGMTQEELGSLCHTTKQTIFKYESGIVTNIPHDRVEQIAAALHVSPAYLLGIEATPDTDPALSRLAAQLNAAGRDKLIAYAEDLVLSGRYTKEDE